MKTKIHPLNLTADTTKLKKLIAEHPDYPIVVIAGHNADNCDSEYFSGTYCSDISFSICEILDCAVPYDEEYVCTDRNEFDERFEEWLWEEINDEKDPTEPMMTDEEFEKILAKEKAKYKPYWKKAIEIFADN